MTRGVKMEERNGRIMKGKKAGERVQFMEVGM